MGFYRKRPITIFPTNACNMRCVYCLANSKDHQNNPISINIDFAKKGIFDYFKENNAPKYIRFYSGGEPTQNMDIIKECYRYAQSIAGEELISEIQTNGFFPEDTRDWIASNISIVWISIDGWEEIHNKYRPVPGDPNPFSTIIENASYINKHTFVGIRSTIVPETVNQQVKIVNFFGDMGFDHISSEPLFAPVKEGLVKKPARSLVSI